MGGILIVLPVIIITGALNVVNIIHSRSAITGPSILVPLFVMVSFAALGGLDDWIGVRRSQGEARFGEGLTGRVKMLIQIVLAGIVAVVFSLYSRDGGFSFANEISLPLMKIVIPISPLLFIPLMIINIVGMATPSISPMASIAWLESSARAHSPDTELSPIYRGRFIGQCALPSLARVLRSCGTMPTRRRCSWATSVRWRLARRWA